jgi:hypothetical protein
MTDNRRTCGLCGQRDRFIGSHVLRAHVAGYPGPDAILRTIHAERIARTGSSKRDATPRAAR